MDNESEMIRQHMEETRGSLQEKLETLEQQVKDTVQEATDAVSDTVESVKDAVQDTVETVKDTVQGTVESVKHTFDLARQVDEHPWAMFAGATALGFIGTRLLSRAMAPASPAGPLASTAAAVAPAPSHGNGFGVTSNVSAPPPAPKQSWWSFIADHYGEELAKVKGLAIASVAGVAREMLIANAAPQIAESVKEVIDGITTKLGAKPIEGPILNPSPQAEESKEEQPSFATLGGRSLGGAKR